MESPVKTYRLTKRFRFESAHRLAKGYVGKCARLHGHSWNGELIVRVQGLDPFDLALDFGGMGKITKAWEETYDHKTMLHEHDPLVLAIGHAGTGPEFPNSVITFMDNPTCETLARVLQGDAERRLAALDLPPGMSILSVAVRIEETCTTSCTYGE